MRRREFIAGVGSAVAWPLAAQAQQRSKPTIGFLSSRADFRSTNSTAAFLRGLGESGYVEGQNVTIEYRPVEDRSDALLTVARELAGRATLIAAYDTTSALAAKSATTTIPVVFSVGADPIKVGLVASLARPNGNVTGVTFFANALGSKRLSLLSELAPATATFGFLFDPSNPNSESEITEMRLSADALGHKLVTASARSESEIDAAFAMLAAQRVGALAVAAHVYLGTRAQQLAQLSLRYHLPAIFAFRDSALAGGLISYGGSTAEAYHQLGMYTARILKGESPSNLPVQQVIRFEVVLNLKTAKALGLTIPPGVLAIADEVIE